jgi:hypothetical protein
MTSEADYPCIDYYDALVAVVGGERFADWQILWRPRSAAKPGSCSGTCTGGRASRTSSTRWLSARESMSVRLNDILTVRQGRSSGLGHSRFHYVRG